MPATLGYRSCSAVVHMSWMSWGCHGKPPPSNLPCNAAVSRPSDHGPQRERRAVGVAGVLPLHAGGRHLLPQGEVKLGLGNWQLVFFVILLRHCLPVIAVAGPQLPCMVSTPAACWVTQHPAAHLCVASRCVASAASSHPWFGFGPLQADICQLGMDQRKVRERLHGAAWGCASLACFHHGSMPAAAHTRTPTSAALRARHDHNPSQMARTPGLATTPHNRPRSPGVCRSTCWLASSATTASPSGSSQ